MTRLACLGLLAVAVLPVPTAAQEVPARSQGAPLSLERALELAVPASSALEIARAAVRGAQGEQYRAKAERFPQLGATLGYSRLLRSQFEGFSFGGDSAGNGEDGGADALPFGRSNTYSLGLTLSQNLFTGGRLSGLGSAADAGRRSADLGLTAAGAQLTLDVVTAYYDAVLADQQLTIAQLALESADTIYRQTNAQFSAGTTPEFELLRSRVARDNQRTFLILRYAERELAYVRLKQLLELPVDQPFTLTTPLGDSAMVAVPALAAVLEESADTAPEHRIPVQQAQEAVRAQEGLLKVARSQQWPSLMLSSQYGNVGYPTGLNPTGVTYYTNWTFAVGLEFPLFTGGRIKGDRMVAQAGLDEARLRLDQMIKLARFDARAAYATLRASQAAWDASVGTVEQAERAYQIAEIRYREGLSTQTEVVDARLALQTAQTTRAQAARELQVARIRMALLDRLPLEGGTSGASIPAVQVGTSSGQTTAAVPVAGMAPGTGTTP